MSSTATSTYLPRFERQPGLSFALTERDTEILKAVNRYRYLRTGQIRRLVFPENRSLQSARRRLRLLYHNGYLGRLVPFVRVGHGGEEVAYHLDKEGEKILADLEEETRSPVKVGQVRPNFLHHALDLSEFRVCLELALKGRKEIELHRFVCDFELKSHGSKRADGRRRYRLFDEIRHPTTKQVHVVYPDGLIILKAHTHAGEKRALYCLEVDRGTEGLRVIQNKLTGYRLYQEHGKLAKFGRFSRFWLLFQTTSAKRARNMATALHDLPGSENVLITTRDQVSATSVLSKPIWTTTSGAERALLK